MSRRHSFPRPAACWVAAAHSARGSAPAFPDLSLRGRWPFLPVVGSFYCQQRSTARGPSRSPASLTVGEAAGPVAPPNCVFSSLRLPGWLPPRTFQPSLLAPLKLAFTSPPPPQTQDMKSVADKFEIKGEPTVYQFFFIFYCSCWYFVLRF